MRENIKEIDEKFPYQIFLLAIANVVTTTVSSIFYSAHNLVISHYHFINISLILNLQKLTKLSQELKSKLKPNINDTLMHCPEASMTWL